MIICFSLEVFCATVCDRSYRPFPGRITTVQMLVFQTNLEKAQQFLNTASSDKQKKTKNLLTQRSSKPWKQICQFSVAVEMYCGKEDRNKTLSISIRAAQFPNKIYKSR